jgi:hypothetical protein
VATGERSAQRKDAPGDAVATGPTPGIEEYRQVAFAPER